MSIAALAHEVNSAAPARASGRALRVNQPGDAFEREAERAANEVMTASPRRARWSLAKIGMMAPLQREAQGAGTTQAVAPAVVHNVLRGAGTPLDSQTRGFMESRFGYDFGRVRIFNDGVAADSARAVSANAYTVGEKIVFAQGRYAPQSPSGRRLLAHELAHTIQQGQSNPNSESSPLAVPRHVPAMTRGAAHHVARQTDPETEAKRKEYEDAVASGQWEHAAEVLNGFNTVDIRRMLAHLSEMQAASIYVGATKNRAVGPNSNVANITRGFFLDMNFKENRQAGNWTEAAKYLNGFNVDDIASRMQKLSQDEKHLLLDAAKSNPELGPESNVAKQAAKALESQPSQEAKQQAAPDKPAQNAPEGKQFALDGKILNYVGREAFGPTAWPFLKAVFEGFVNGLKGDLAAGRGQQAKSHLLKLMVPTNAAKFYGGYLVGLILGLISPITDLVKGVIGIVKIAGSALEWLAKWSPAGVAISPERQQKIANLIQKFTNLGVQFGNALAEFVKDPEGSAKKFSDFLDSMMKLALGEARQMGAKAAHSIFDFLGEDYYEMGKSIGKVIGTLIAQVLLIVFSEAIGNLISEAASMLGKIADFVAGKAAEFIEWMLQFASKVIGKIRELINKGIKLFKGLFESLGEAFQALKALFTEGEEVASGLKAVPAGGAKLGEIPKINIAESRMVSGARTSPAKVSDLTPPKIHPSKAGATTPAKPTSGTYSGPKSSSEAVKDLERSSGRAPVNEAATIGTEIERMEIQKWAAELEGKGYRVSPRNEFGKMRLGNRRLSEFFTDQRARPDMVAIHSGNKTILVGDITSNPGSLAKIPGRIGEEEGLHIEKTIEYARQLKRQLPPEFKDYKIFAQDKHWQTGKATKLIAVN